MKSLSETIIYKLGIIRSFYIGTKEHKQYVPRLLAHNIHAKLYYAKIKQTDSRAV